MPRFIVALAIGVAVICTGCSDHIATYPVSGTVHFADGEPTRIGYIEFHGTEARLSARAKLNDEGAYSLGTYTAGDGAPAGEYQVVIVQYFNEPPPGHVHPSDARVAPKFSNVSSTPLKATVRADADNKFEFVVTHPKQPLRKGPKK